MQIMYEMKGKGIYTLNLFVVWRVLWMIYITVLSQSSFLDLYQKKSSFSYVLFTNLNIPPPLKKIDIPYMAIS